eukprot:Gb_38499 [translate_table: standard]
MTRKCSHCGHNGHNSRTCPNRGVKLFGVRLTDGPIRKSASMGNLMHYSNVNNPSSPIEPSESAAAADGYVSDGLVQASSSSNCRERKKGVPWTEDEHRMFLLGLQKLGKGDWRGIARNFVITRTPTQVASHAQKYFIRQSNMTRRKRRSSLFDMIAEAEPTATAMPGDDYSMVDPGNPGHENPAEIQLLPSGLNPLLDQGQFVEPKTGAPLSSHSASDQECESVDSATSADVETPASQGSASIGCGVPAIFPGFVAPFVPIPFPFWPSLRPTANELPPNSNIFKPRAKIPKAPMNVEEFTGISHLSLGDSPGSIEPSALSLKLLDRPSRQSAFHTNPSINNGSFSPNGNAIHVA